MTDPADALIETALVLAATPPDGAMSCVECGGEWHPCEHCGAIEDECPVCRFWDRAINDGPPCCEADAAYRDRVAAAMPSVARARGWATP